MPISSIVVSDGERLSGKLTEKNLELAIRYLHHDGLVVVKNAIEHHHLDKLNKKMTADALTLAARGANSPYNYNRGNLQQDSPPVKEYFEPSIFLSKSALL